jgi:hypothetical protein
LDGPRRPRWTPASTPSVNVCFRGRQNIRRTANLGRNAPLVSGQAGLISRQIAAVYPGTFVIRAYFNRRALEAVARRTIVSSGSKATSISP